MYSESWDLQTFSAEEDLSQFPSRRCWRYSIQTKDVGGEYIECIQVRQVQCEIHQLGAIALVIYVGLAELAGTFPSDFQMTINVTNFPSAPATSAVTGGCERIAPLSAPPINWQVGCWLDELSEACVYSSLSNAADDDHRCCHLTPTVTATDRTGYLTIFLMLASYFCYGICQNRCVQIAYRSYNNSRPGVHLSKYGPVIVTHVGDT